MPSPLPTLCVCNLKLRGGIKCGETFKSEKDLISHAHRETMTTAFNTDIGTKMLHALFILLQEFQAASVYPRTWPIVTYDLFYFISVIPEG